VDNKIGKQRSIRIHVYALKRFSTVTNNPNKKQHNVIANFKAEFKMP